MTHPNWLSNLIINLLGFSLTVTTQVTNWYLVTIITSLLGFAYIRCLEQITDIPQMVVKRWWFTMVQSVETSPKRNKSKITMSIHVWWNPKSGDQKPPQMVLKPVVNNGITYQPSWLVGIHQAAGHLPGDVARSLSWYPTWSFPRGNGDQTWKRAPHVPKNIFFWAPTLYFRGVNIHVLLKICQNLWIKKWKHGARYMYICLLLSLCDHSNHCYHYVYSKGTCNEQW